MAILSSQWRFLRWSLVFAIALAIVLFGSFSISPLDAGSSVADQPAAVEAVSSQMLDNLGGWPSPSTATCLVSSGLTPLNVAANPTLDASMVTERDSMLALVPLGAMSHVAVRDGRWSDPGTWQNNSVPAAWSNVHIPAGMTVTYDAFTSERIYTIRVDGTMRFATDQNTRLVVDTIVVTTQGAWVMGTAGEPIPQGVVAEVLFANNGPISTDWDPLMLSRGLLNRGSTTIYGAPKTTFLSIATPPVAGANQLVLSETPVNWRTGDRIVVTAAHYRPRQWDNSISQLRYYGSYDEERVIVNIQGNVVTLNAPLTYDHVPPRPEFSVYAANYTRNVRFETQNASNVPTQQRGHIMFMHSDQIDINHAGFYELGRTDKSRWVTDVQLDAGGRQMPGTGANSRGRYAVHVHRAGFDGTPALLRGNALIGSPGWGFVSHESYVIMEDNASFDVFGSHFVTENGDELGAFRRNIAIRSEGDAVRHFKDGTPTHDLGYNGHGFWLQGRLVEVEGNVASGHDNIAFFFFHRSATINPRIPLGHLDVPGTAKFQTSMYYNDVTLKHFVDNEAFASGSGFSIVKFQPDQGHDRRNVVRDFQSWHNFEGFHLEYVGHYTLQDITVVGDPEFADDPWTAGVTVHQRVRKLVFDNVEVSGYRYGVVAASGTTDVTDFVALDSSFTNNQIPFANFYRNIPFNIDPQLHVFVQTGDFTPYPLSFEPDDNMDFTLPWAPSGLEEGSFILRGTKRDSLGEVAHESIFNGADIYRHLTDVGHYTREDGSTFILVREYVFDRLTNHYQAYSYEVDAPLTYGGPNLGDPYNYTHQFYLMMIAHSSSGR